MKRFLAFLLALLPITLITPMAQANLTCSNGSCTQVYYYTGSTQEFVVPQGVTSIRFEVFGASGSRGGAGGSVAGTLTQIPERLLIEVGQAGSFGVNKPGGYNGGGASGGSKGTEGSGGGASDIRLESSLESRIVVAGGGGGGGGGTGGTGGSGGSLLGSTGISGDGTAGSGGTQEGPGVAGIGSGAGQAATAGGFGFGGDGGFGSLAGGGGGGGGWFGGAGGGGDSTAAGGEGGGGGGGSSYAATTHTSNVVHKSGVQWGNGRVYIYYQLPSEVVSFTGAQISQSQLKFSLTLNQSVQGLTAGDLVISEPSCTIWRISINLANADITLNNCPTADVTLTLKALSVGTGSLGPLTEISRTAAFDRTGPSFGWLDSDFSTSLSSAVLNFTVSDAVALVSSSFVVTGCQVELVGEQLLLSECVEGEQTAKVPAGALLDSWGNPGPMSDQVLRFTVDQTPPSASWSAVEVSGVGPFTYSTQLLLSETASYPTDAISFSSDAQCLTGEDGLIFWAECDFGTVSWSFDSSQLVDSVGHVGVGVVAVSKTHGAPLALQPEPEAIAPEPEPEAATESEVISTENATASEQAVSDTETASEQVAPDPVVPVAPAQPDQQFPNFEPAQATAPVESNRAESAAEAVVPTVSESPAPVVPEEEPVFEAISDPVLELPVEILVQDVFEPGPIAQVEKSEPEPLATEQPQVESAGELPSVEVTEPVLEEAELAVALSGPKLRFQEPDQTPLIASGLIAALLIGIGIWRFSGR